MDVFLKFFAQKSFEQGALLPCSPVLFGIVRLFAGLEQRFAGKESDYCLNIAMRSCRKDGL